MRARNVPHERAGHGRTPGRPLRGRREAVRSGVSASVPLFKEEGISEDVFIQASPEAGKDRGAVLVPLCYED